MAFIAAYWWLWLTVTGISLLFMASKVFGVFSGFKKAADGFQSGKVGQVDDGLMQSIGTGAGMFSMKTLLVNLAGGIAGILLFISVVIHLVNYLK